MLRIVVAMDLPISMQENIFFLRLIVKINQVILLHIKIDSAVLVKNSESVLTLTFFCKLDLGSFIMPFCKSISNIDLVLISSMKFVSFFLCFVPLNLAPSVALVMVVISGLVF